MQTTFINTQLAKENNELSDCIKAVMDKLQSTGQVEIIGNATQVHDIISALNGQALLVYQKVSGDNDGCVVTAKLISKINPGRLSMVGRPPAWSQNE